MRTLPILLTTAALLGGCRAEYNFVPRAEPPPLQEDHGLWLDMETAPDGVPVAAYYDRNMGAVGFAVGREVEPGVLVWEHEEVDGYPEDGLNPGERGTYLSMEVAPDGTTWMSYHDQRRGSLRVSHRVGAKWQEPEVIDTGSGIEPKAGTWTSLQIDANGNPVIAYHDDVEGNLKVAHYDGSAFTTEVARQGTSSTSVDDEGTEVTAEADAGEYARLLIDGNTEYIAFYDKAHGELHLLEGFAGAYTHSVIDDGDGADVGQWPSLALDNGDLVVSYQDITNQDLKFARRSGGSWTREIVDDALYVGADSELLITDGTISVLYFDGQENNVKRAVNTGSQWQLSTLGGETTALGFFNEAIQVNGEWVIGCYDYTNRRIHTQAL